MSKIELVTSKLQDMLGNHYMIFSNSHFRKNYTEAKQVVENGNIGYAFYTNSQYGDLRKNKVIGIMQLSNATRSNVGFYYLTAGYRIDFSVPRNIWKTNSNDRFIESPSFNFDNDIQELIESVTGSVIDLGDDYRFKITMSEPSFVTTEKDGEFEYDIMQVSGQIILSDKVLFGGEYKVAFLINNEYVEIDGLNTFNEIYDVNSNAIQIQGTQKTKQNPAQSGWVATFQVDDIETENEARLLIYSIIHQNLEIINSGASTEKLKREIPTKITSPHGYIHEFNAVISIDFRSNANGVGSYVVTLTDDGGI